MREAGPGHSQYRSFCLQLDCFDGDLGSAGGTRLRDRRVSAPGPPVYRIRVEWDIVSRVTSIYRGGFAGGMPVPHPSGLRV